MQDKAKFIDYIDLKLCGFVCTFDLENPRLVPQHIVSLSTGVRVYLARITHKKG